MIDPEPFDFGEPEYDVFENEMLLHVDALLYGVKMMDTNGKRIDPSTAKPYDSTLPGIRYPA